MNTAVVGLLILVALLVLYASELFPAYIISILGAMSYAWIGAIEYKAAFANYGADVLLLSIGVMILGGTLFEVGFSEWFGSKVNILFKGNERSILFALIACVSIVSAFVSNTAAMAMFIPIFGAIAKGSGGKVKVKYLAMAVAFASVAGGNLTLIGSTIQVTMNGVLAEGGYEQLTMMTMFWPALILLVLMVIYFVTIGDTIQHKVLANLPDPTDEATNAAAAVAGETKEVDQKKLIIVGIIFVLTVIGFLRGVWTLGFVGVSAGAACIIFRLVDGKKALKELVDWQAIGVMGGVMGIASGVNASGAGKMVAEWIINAFGGQNASPFAILAALCITATLLTNVMNNITIAGILMPIGLSIASTLGVNTMPFAVGIILAASLAFATPIGTTPVTMTMYVGYRFFDYTKIGGLFTIIGCIAVIVTMPIFYPF